LYDVVPPADLPNGIALYQMVFNGSMLFGPSIGGLLIPWIGTDGCFFTATGGNLIVLLSIFLMRISRTRRPHSKKSLTRETIEGLSLAWHMPIFLALFTTLGIVTFCTKPYTQFMPVFARDILQVGAPGLGLLLMAPGAGAIVGGLTLASIRRFPRPHFQLFSLAAGFGLSIFLFACSQDFRLSLIWLFFAGGFQTTFLSSTATLLQLHADESNRGRIMSLFGLINRGLGPMGSFPFGLLASVMGAPWTVAACGLLTIVLVGYMAFFRPALGLARRAGET
jgi:predicted MFS family arabinose efflux permease